MGKSVMFGGVLCALLLAASPALAIITANLEEPAEGSASGIVQIRGWARATDDAEVTVRLRVNGVTRTGDDAIIPCCSLRADVTSDVPTGFSAQVNYGVFPAGPLTIGVEITAPGCDPVIVDRSVQVVKLGGEEFASDVDLSTATINIVDGNIVITGAEVNPPDNLILSYNAPSQAFTVTSGNFSTAANFIANITVDQTEPPSTGSTAMGQGFFMLNEDMTLMYRVVLPEDGLTSGFFNIQVPDVGESSAHIHSGAAGVPGGIEIFLEPAVPTATDGAFIWEGTTAALSGDQKAALQAGEWYVNIHTTDNGSGEVRGQIVAAGGMPGCADSSRPFFLTGSPDIPESQSPTPHIGCRLLNEDLCGKGWQYAGGLAAFGAASCFYAGAEFGCVACGPNNQTSGFCTNSCAAQ